MKSWLKKNRLYIAGALIGAIGGYFYYLEVGCLNGSCTISSSPINSALYGALMGSVFLSLFEKKTKEQAS